MVKRGDPEPTAAPFRPTTAAAVVHAASMTIATRSRRVPTGRTRCARRPPAPHRRGRLQRSQAGRHGETPSAGRGEPDQDDEPVMFGREDVPEPEEARRVDEAATTVKAARVTTSGGGGRLGSLICIPPSRDGDGRGRSR